MKEKKIPIRTCAITGEKLPKWDLFRVVRTPEGNVILDDDSRGKTNGRGAYLKKDLEVIEKASKSKVLDKKLEATVGSEVYEELRKVLRK